MVATTMVSTLSLVNKLRQDLPDIRLASGDTFRWSPHEHTVYYIEGADIDSLLHEVAHAVLGHEHYSTDIDLIKMERDAWNLAAADLAGRYGMTIDESTVQDSLDTYRNWLHARSTCPGCAATGLQVSQMHYSCLACTTRWRVNEARTCTLRRYTSSSY